MTGVCTELRLCSISNAVDDRRLLIVRSVYKNQELQFQENCPIFIYTRVLAIWSWSYTHFWDTGFAHSLYIAVKKVCDSVVTYNCKLILEVLLSSTNNTWLAKVSKLDCPFKWNLRWLYPQHLFSVTPVLPTCCTVCSTVYWTAQHNPRTFPGVPSTFIFLKYYAIYPIKDLVSVLYIPLLIILLFSFAPI